MERQHRLRLYHQHDHAEDGNFITLRYYSSYYHNIFHSDDVFPFVNGSQQGTASNPLRVGFSEENKQQ